MVDTLYGDNAPAKPSFAGLLGHGYIEKKDVRVVEFSSGRPSIRLIGADRVHIDV